MLITKKPHLFFICFFFTLIFNLAQAQKPSSSIYDYYDWRVGKESLDINNGKILLNYDRVLNDLDRFYFSSYQVGSVIYDNQYYNNVLLNYDVFEDQLIIKPNGEFDKAPIILIKEKVSSFTVLGTTYVNIKNSTVLSGFYEEQFVDKKVSLYIKHNKYKRDLISNDKVYDDFTIYTFYALKYNNAYYEIDSKKSITSIFPDLKKNISSFYANNETIEKANKTKFIADLIAYLNTILK